MRSHTLKKLQRHSIWLSLLLHLLLLLGFTTVLLLTPEKELPSNSPEASVPSYLSPSPEAPPAPVVPEQKPDPRPEPKPEPKPAPEVKAEPKPEIQPEPKEVDKNGIEKPLAKKSQPAKAAAKPKSSRDARNVSFARDAVPENITDPRDQEPLHLVGESKIIKPLVKILARALSRHLTYPRVAADFNLRGVVLVGFVLHPEGYVTEARVVKSSGAGVLDDEARDAVGAMSPVGDVHEYVSAPEFLVVGIIFG
jgi:protein TonB